MHRMISFEEIYLKMSRVCMHKRPFALLFSNILPQMIPFNASHTLHNDYFCSVEVWNKVYKIICARLYKFADVMLEVKNLKGANIAKLEIKNSNLFSILHFHYLPQVFKLTDTSNLYI